MAEATTQEMWDYCLNSGHKAIVTLDVVGVSWQSLNSASRSTLRTEYAILREEERKRVNRDWGFKTGVTKAER